MIGLGVSRTSRVYCFSCSISFGMDETRCRLASSMVVFSELCEVAFLVVKPSCYICGEGSSMLSMV